MKELYKIILMSKRGKLDKNGGIGAGKVQTSKVHIFETQTWMEGFLPLIPLVIKINIYWK